MDPREVRKKRREEIGYIKKHGVYRKVKRSSVPEGTTVIRSGGSTSIKETMATQISDRAWWRRISKRKTYQNYSQEHRH